MAASPPDDRLLELKGTISLRKPSSKQKFELELDVRRSGESLAAANRQCDQFVDLIEKAEEVARKLKEEMETRHFRARIGQ